MSSADHLSPPDYEPEDARPPVVVVTAASLAAIVALGLGVAAFLHSRDLHRSPGRPPPADTLFQHGPGERNSVAESWDEVDRAVRDHLEGYAWIDRQAGIARIPIERAMDLICTEQKAPAQKPDNERAAP
jgi:hypothetical protein